MPRDIPILFSAPMVRALLDGTKTQTRRPLKPQIELVGNDYSWHTKGFSIEGPQSRLPFALREGISTGANMSGIVDFCPYGQPGDRLWVRETHAISESPSYADGQSHSVTIYRADQDPALDAEWRDSGGVWKPSIFMRREHSRITLEVTDVRVERLQDISEEDCIAEGVEKAGPHGYGWRKYTDPAVVCTTARQSYGSLWESINGPGSLDLNPWVWCVSFRRV